MEFSFLIYLLLKYLHFLNMIVTVNKVQKKLILILHELSKDTDKGSELGRMMFFCSVYMMYFYIKIPYISRSL